MARNTTDLLVRFNADTSELLKGMDKAQKAEEKQNKAYDRLARDMGIKGAAITGTFALMVNSASKYGEQIDKVSKTTGIATDVISSLGYAAKQEHASLEALSTGLRQLSKNMNDFRAGTGEAKVAFEALGLSVTDSNGQLLSADTMLMTIADRFAGMTNETERSALAMRIFGEAGVQLIPFLSMGSKEIGRLQQEAKDLGIAIDSSSTKAFKAFRDEVDKAQGAFQGLQILIAQDVLPMFADVTKGTAELVTALQKIPEPVRRFGVNTTLAAGGLMAMVAGAVAGIARLKGLATAAGTSLAVLGKFIAIPAILFGLVKASDAAREAAGEYNWELQRQADLLEEIASIDRKIASDMDADMAGAQGYNALLERRKSLMDDIAQSARTLSDIEARSQWAEELSMDTARADAWRQSAGNTNAPPTAKGTGKVITTLDILEFKLKRADSAFRIYEHSTRLAADSSEFLAGKQDHLLTKLDLVNKQVEMLEASYRAAGGANAAYNEENMKLIEQLDTAREKQAEFTRALKDTEEQMNQTANAGMELAHAYIRQAMAAGGEMSGDAIRALAGVGTSYINPNIKGLPPGLADGGIVKARAGGTLIRAGEGGEDEYVIPASKMGGGSIVVNVHGSVLSERDLQSVVVDAIRRVRRETGNVV